MLTDLEEEIINRHWDEVKGKETCRRCIYYSNPVSGFCDFYFEDDIPGDHKCCHIKLDERMFPPWVQLKSQKKK